MRGTEDHCADEGAPDRLKLALRASNEGIWDWWAGEEKIFYSRRILEFLECSESAAPNLFLSPYEPVHPDDGERFGALLDGALSAGGPELFAVDCRVRTGSGGWRWLRIRGVVVRDRRGEAQRIVGSMIDISRRKNAESKLEDEHHLLGLVIENVPLQIYLKDLESKFVLANRQMAEWLGLGDTRELIGKHDRDFFAHEHWKQAAADEKSIIESGTPMLGMLEKETWRGREETWVLTSKFPWRGPDGKMRGTFGVSSDVTELVKARQKSESLARQLKARNEMYEEELLLAREIQHALTLGAFPAIGPSGDGRQLKFSSRYLPISGLAGDFFEVLKIGPDKAGLLICDVMGHGVRASLVVAMIRGLVEKELHHAADPGKFLSGLNRGLMAILGRTEVTIFVTAFYATIDLAAGEVRFANAGHPCAIACFDDGERQMGSARDEKGPALGLVRKTKFPTVNLPLSGLRRIVMFTDGLLEAENESGEAFLETRLIETLGECRKQTLDKTLDAVLERVLEFSRNDQFDDDVCLLGVDIREK
jgi:sigma-B regulation protein RsbU (phosphoserine phosphatase)